MKKSLFKKKTMIGSMMIKYMTSTIIMSIFYFNFVLFFFVNLMLQSSSLFADVQKYRRRCRQCYEWRKKNCLLFFSMNLDYHYKNQNNKKKKSYSLKPKSNIYASCVCVCVCVCSSSFIHPLLIIFHSAHVCFFYNMFDIDIDRFLVAISIIKIRIECFGFFWGEKNVNKSFERRRKTFRFN